MTRAGKDGQRGVVPGGLTPLGHRDRKPAYVKRASAGRPLRTPGKAPPADRHAGRADREPAESAGAGRGGSGEGEAPDERADLRARAREGGAREGAAVEQGAPAGSVSR